MLNGIQIVLYLEIIFQVKALCFDQSGTYLAIAGTDVR